MNQEELNKANNLSKQISELEGFLFWCSGKRDRQEGFYKYPAAILAVKRKWYGAMESREYAMPKRLQEKVVEAVEEELTLLREELETL